MAFLSEKFTPMKIAALIQSLLFVLFAGFQFNDPDGSVWTILYGNMAILCFLAFLGKFYKWWSVVSLAVYGIYFIYLSPAIFDFFSDNFQENVRSAMTFEKHYIEQTREAGGLLICIASLTFLHFASRRSTS